MAATCCIQDLYRCDTCKCASDIHGRGCSHGMLFPVLLVMGNKTECPNYEFDKAKVQEQLTTKRQ